MKTRVCKPNSLGVAICVGDGAIPEPLKRHTCGDDGGKGPQPVGKHHDGHDSVRGIASVLVAKDADIQHQDGDFGKEQRHQVPKDGVPPSLWRLLAFLTL